MLNVSDALSDIDPPISVKATDPAAPTPTPPPKAMPVLWKSFDDEAVTDTSSRAFKVVPSPIVARTVLRETVATSPIPIPAVPPIAAAPAAPWVITSSSAMTFTDCAALSL